MWHVYVTDERAAAAAAERAAFEAELTAKHAAVLAKLASDDSVLLDRERAAQASQGKTCLLA